MLARVRSFLFRQLDPEAWDHHGLSPTNWTIVCVIWASILFAVLATEPTFVASMGENLILLDRLILALFAVEYAARLFVAGLNPKFTGARGLVRYVARPSSIADLIVIAPVFLAAPPTWMMMFRLLRVLRLVRLATMPKFKRAMVEFCEAINAKRFEYAFTFCLTLILVLLASITLFLLEGRLQPEVFGSIPRAIWWSIVTFTTVGYGDAVPISGAGRFFAGVFAISGVGLVAMFTGITASALSDAAQLHKNNQSQGDGESAPQD